MGHWWQLHAAPPKSVQSRDCPSLKASAIKGQSCHDQGKLAIKKTTVATSRDIITQFQKEYQ
jgi:hypothetical protein